MASQDQEVKLIGFWVSPFVYRVEWALKLKGVSYKYIEEDILNKTPLLSQLNPVFKRVPALVHNEKPVLESLQILEYIDETWKHCLLLPTDPLERATTRFWANFAEEKFFRPPFFAMLSEGERKESALKLSKEALETIEEELMKKKKTKFFGGETSLGYLDLALGWISHWLPAWEEVGSMKIVDPVQFPATAAWMNNFVNHPMIMEKLPDKSKMLEFLEGRVKEWGPLVAAGKFKI